MSLVWRFRAPFDNHGYVGLVVFNLNVIFFVLTLFYYVSIFGLGGRFCAACSVERLYFQLSLVKIDRFSRLITFCYNLI